MSTTYPTATDDERETAIEAAAQAVQRGGLVVLPTDTVYGIGADAFDHAAVQALLDAKGRGSRDAAAGPDQLRDHARRAGHRTSSRTSTRSPRRSGPARSPWSATSSRR